MQTPENKFMKQLSLKEMEIIVADFTHKVEGIDAKVLCQAILETYQEALGHDVRVIQTSRNPSERARAISCVEVPRYSCYFKWEPYWDGDIMNSKRKYRFHVHFVPKKDGESTFVKTLAEFLFFYDNPNGVLRLESLAFQFQ